MIYLQTDFPLALDSFDHVYPDSVYVDNWSSPKFVDEMLKFFRRPVKFLDLGCAGGNLVLDFKKRGCLAVGIDGSDQCLNPNKTLVINRGFLPNGYYNWQDNYNKYFFTADVSKNYQLMENDAPLMFDLITAFNLLERINPDQVDTALEMISNHLEDGGVFVGSISLHSSFGRGNMPDIEYHKSVFPMNWWIEKLQKYFQIIKYPASEYYRESNDENFAFGAIRHTRKKLRKTIISHFYNEEYLLPWWLNHHKNMFDHGIMVDYDSTDRSVEIIRKLCPEWTIIRSKNRDFDTYAVDDEVMELEGYMDGYKIALNTTEFFVGDTSILDHVNNVARIYIPCLAMCDPPEESYKTPTYDLPLIKQKYYGLDFEKSYPIRYNRLIHNGPESYVFGRHYWASHPEFRLAVLWYGWSPYNAKILHRRKQCRDRMPPINPADPDAHVNGRQHRWTLEEERQAYLDCVQDTQDLRPILKNLGVNFD